MIDITNWLFAAHAWATAVVSIFIARQQSRRSARSAGFPACRLCGRARATGSPPTPICVRVAARGESRNGLQQLRGG